MRNHLVLSVKASGGACPVIMPVRMCATRRVHGVVPACDPAGRLRLGLRLVVVHASNQPNDPTSTPNVSNQLPSLDAIAREYFGTDFQKLSSKDQQWCSSKRANIARWQGHTNKAKPEDDELLQRFAQALYGKPYQQLTTEQKKACAGKKGEVVLAAKREKDLEDLAKIDYEGMPREKALEMIAQEKFGRPYLDLDAREKKSVANTKSFRIKKLREAQG